MRSPFKFLDPYEYADKEVFFGRDRETQTLYETLFKTSLLLVYGLSGTGKTSLIRCGLANRFDGTDWYPMFIRRDGDLNASLKRHIQRVLGGDYSGDVSLDLREIYEEYLRPPYLIFDQFEELFILGNKTEQQKFIQQIALILEKELPCKVLLVIREEYLGRLYYFEEAVPEIFDHRVRVEPMGRQQVGQVIEDSFRKFNINLTGDPDTLISEIISSVSEEKSLIPLPYLQVYLDFLYKSVYPKAYGDEEESLPAVKVSETDISQLGKIDDVLEQFLDEQEISLFKKLTEDYPDLNKEAFRGVLDAFVTEDGTKNPLTYERENEIIQITSTESRIPAISDALLTAMLELLEAARILRIGDYQIELAHDSLASLIDEKRSDFQRRKYELKRRIQVAYEEQQETGQYLSRKQLTIYEEILPALELEEELQDFIAASYEVVEEEEAREKAEQEEKLRIAEEKLKAEEAARKEKELSLKRQQRFIILIIIISILAIGAAIWGWNSQLAATEALDNLKEATAKKENAEAEAVLVEVRDIEKRAMELQEDFPDIHDSLIMDAIRVIEAAPENTRLEQKKDSLQRLLP